jgi:hypothetical protein
MCLTVGTIFMAGANVNVNLGDKKKIPFLTIKTDRSNFHTNFVKCNQTAFPEFDVTVIGIIRISV